MNWKEHKKRLMKEPGFKAEYDALELEYKLARELIRLRLSKGLTQEQLAKKINTKQAGIARLESGSRLPSLSTIRKVAEALDADLDIVLRPKRAQDPAVPTR
ncbi:MAG TPA: helix-turn-helix transcriptional regulator [Dehalococcoidia bacterium]|nr:helix-turn-helix transcriptional regulator [Dehalococcoidia bacterium]